MDHQHQGGGGGGAGTRAVAEVVAAVAELLQHVLAAGRDYLHMSHGIKQLSPFVRLAFYV